jgi:hypothetical protein
MSGPSRSLVEGGFYFKLYNCQNLILQIKKARMIWPIPEFELELYRDREKAGVLAC